MKKQPNDKFVRIISPITTAVVFILDIAVVGFGVFAVKNLMANRTTLVIVFALIELLAIAIAVLVTREIFLNGVIFRDDEMEFLGLDDNNIFKYDNITDVQSEKDDKASFSKNFVDRHAKLIVTMDDESVTTIDIGLCTKYTLDVIRKEATIRSGLEYIPPKDYEKIQKDQRAKQKAERKAAKLKESKPELPKAEVKKSDVGEEPAPKTEVKSEPQDKPDTNDLEPPKRY